MADLSGKNLLDELYIARSVARQKAAWHGSSTWPVEINRRRGIAVTATKQSGGGFRMKEEKYTVAPRRKNT